MRVHISSVDFDLNGAVVLEVSDSDSDLGDTRRRMNRIATLDGGVVLNDFGFAEGDRSVSLSWTPVSAADEEAVAYLVRTHSRLRLACRLGCFEVAPESFKVQGGKATLSLLVVKKLSV